MLVVQPRQDRAKALYALFGPERLRRWAENVSAATCDMVSIASGFDARSF